MGAKQLDVVLTDLPTREKAAHQGVHVQPKLSFPGELDELEQVVAHAERAPSLAAAGDALRRDAVELPGAMRWVERRVRLAHQVLGIVIGLLPEHLARCIAEKGAVRTRLHTETALRAPRTLVAEQLEHAVVELRL